MDINDNVESTMDYDEDDEDAAGNDVRLDGIIKIDRPFILLFA